MSGSAFSYLFMLHLPFSCFMGNAYQVNKLMKNQTSRDHYELVKRTGQTQAAIGTLCYLMSQRPLHSPMTIVFGCVYGSIITYGAFIGISDVYHDQRKNRPLQRLNEACNSLKVPNLDDLKHDKTLARTLMPRTLEGIPTEL